MNAVSLFAGVGGFDLALENRGVRVVAAVENDDKCQKVLAGHFPEAVLLGDVKEVKGDQLLEAGFQPEDGIITAGWPCQGNSVAGHRGGMADPRSGLWRDVGRIVGEVQPRWFLGENVPGLLNVNGGRDFREVISTLAELGYGVAWRVLDAQYFGVPQRRRRVIVVGCLGDRARPVEVLFEPEGSARDLAQGGEAWPKNPGRSVVSTLQAGGGQRGYRVDAEAAAGGHLIPVCVTGRVAHTLRSEGADASEDGTGRGTPIVAVPVAIRGRAGGSQIETGVQGDPAFTLRTPGGGSSNPMVAVTVIDPAYALTAHHGRDDRESNYDVVGFSENQRGEVVESAVHHQLTCGGGKPGQGYPAVRVDTAVRRLTPMECERLQGFPDGWTAGQSDSKRYHQLGNAVAVPVVQWVVDRVITSDAEHMSSVKSRLELAA